MYISNKRIACLTSRECANKTKVHILSIAIVRYIFFVKNQNNDSQWTRSCAMISMHLLQYVVWQQFYACPRMHSHPVNTLDGNRTFHLDIFLVQLPCHVYWLMLFPTRKVSFLRYFYFWHFVRCLFMNDTCLMHHKLGKRLYWSYKILLR